MLSKKKLTELFLRKEDRQKLEEAARQQQQSIPFDENYFEFRIESHPTQLGLIKVQAVIVKGEKMGQKLNMKCKWFNRTEHDFREIAQVSGCYYQPSIDDVNTTVSVQAQPFMEGKEYQGITIMREIGPPLKLDDKVEIASQKAIREQRLEMPVRLQTIFSQDERFSKIEPPQDILSITTSSELKIYVKNVGNKYDLLVAYPFTQNYPTIEIIRKTRSSFLLNVSDSQSFRIAAEDNMQRDVIALVIKTFCGRKLVSQTHPTIKETTREQQESNVQTKESKSGIPTSGQLSSVRQQIPPSLQPNLDFILKLDEMSRNLINTKRDLNRLQEDYDSQRKIQSKLLEQNQCLLKKIGSLEQLVQQYNRSKYQSEKLHQQNIFYSSVCIKDIQEIGIYKNTIRAKDNIIEQLNCKIKDFDERERNWKKQQQQHAHEPLERIKELQEQLAELAAKLQKSENIIQEQQQQIVKIYLKQERYEDEKKRMLKRYEGLAEQSALKQHDIAQQRHKHQLEQKQVQITTLKNHIFKLEFLYSKLQAQRKQDEKVWDLKQIVNGLKGTKNQQAAMGYLQKLVNNLTETVSQKQIELQSQKLINKQLMRRLNLA